MEQSKMLLIPMVVGILTMMFICLVYFRERKIEKGGVGLAAIAMILLLGPLYKEISFKADADGISAALSGIKEMDQKVSQIKDDNAAINNQINALSSQLQNNPGIASNQNLQNMIQDIRRKSESLRTKISEAENNQIEIKKSIRKTRFANLIR